MREKDEYDSENSVRQPPIGEKDDYDAMRRVMRAAVPIPALASASVLQSAAVGASVVGVVGPL